MTCELDDVDKRRFIVLFRFDALFCPECDRSLLGSRTGIKTHGKAKSFFDNSPFKEYTVAVFRDFTWNYLVRDFGKLRKVTLFVLI